MADKEKKTIEIKTGIEPNKVEMNIDYNKLNNDTFIEKSREIKQTGVGHPTYNPTEFKEQFYFEDNGSLWVNIGNTWKEFIPA
jgi:hypothetical protein